MKIGVLAYRQQPYISANTAIAYIVGKQLSKTEEIVFIGRRQNYIQKDGDTYHGIRIKYLNTEPLDHYSRINNLLQRQGWMSLAFREEAKYIHSIVREEKLDALICMTAPNDDAYIALSANLKIPIYIYQLDPFYNLDDAENKLLKKLFIKYLEQIQHVFTTSLLMDSYQKDNLIKPFLNKITVLEFPKLIYHCDRVDGNNGKGIRLLYAGSLYANRKPSFLIDLKQILPHEFNIIFCGNCVNETDIDLLKKEGVLCLGYCDQVKLEEEIDKASFLINIGNTVKNQLPSKVIDYISTGKPIINLIQRNDCPSLEVLKDYPYALNIMASEIKERRKEITDFVTQNKNNRVSWNVLSRIYREYTPEYVSEKIIDIIRKDLKQTEY